MAKTMNLFAYGSLMVPAVLHQVVGKDFSSSPAVLRGWKRCQVQGESYPAIIPVAEQAVSGVLWLGLSEKEFLLLDAFEGKEYRRVSVLVTNPQGESVNAQTYAWEKLRGLVDKPWDFEWFKTEGIKSFSRSYLPGVSQERL